MKRRRRDCWVVVGLWLAGCAPKAPSVVEAAGAPAASGAREVQVFVPCGLAGPYGDAIAGFSRAHPDITVRRTLENELPLRNRILEGARPDVFISLGDFELEELYAGGQIDRANVRNIALAPLALVAPPGNPLKLARLEDLLKPEVKHIALGHPEKFSAGRMGRQALEKLGLWDKLQPKLLQTPKAAFLLNFVASGKVDATIAYKSCIGEVHHPGDQPKETSVTYVCDVPSDLHDPIHVAAAMINGGPNPETARLLLDYLATPAARECFVKWFFDPLPDAGAAG